MCRGMSHNYKKKAGLQGYMPEAWRRKPALAGGGCTRVHPYFE